MALPLVEDVKRTGATLVYRGAGMRRAHRKRKIADFGQVLSEPGCILTGVIDWHRETWLILSQGGTRHREAVGAAPTSNPNSEHCRVSETES